MLAHLQEHCRTAIHTSLGFDFHADEIVDSENDEIRHHIENTHTHEDLRIVKGNSFRHLHHPKDDHQIGTETLVSQECSTALGTCIHLRVC